MSIIIIIFNPIIIIIIIIIVVVVIVLLFFIVIIIIIYYIVIVVVAGTVVQFCWSDEQKMRWLQQCQSSSSNMIHHLFFVCLFGIFSLCDSIVLKMSVHWEP